MSRNKGTADAQYHLPCWPDRRRDRASEAARGLLTATRHPSSTNRKDLAMRGIIYLVGLVVIVLAIVQFVL